MRRGDIKQLSLKEHHVVDEFVYNLMNELPAGSTWLGVTRLQSVSAWQEKTAHSAYFRFQQLVEERVRRSTIDYWRLWRLDDGEQRDRVWDVLQQQDRAGLQIRYVVGGKPIEDMSIIWVPTQPMSQSIKLKNQERPIDEIRQAGSLQPLCAIEFVTRAGRELEEMRLYSPEHDSFRALCFEFGDCWARGERVG